MSGPDPIRVLLVDDHAIVRDGIRSLLTTEPDIQVVGGADNGRHGISMAEQLQPDVILMDEPCSALDPVATLKIEELMFELRDEYTILIVTHNMAQARRASEECIFMLMGKVVEHTETGQMFVTPQHQETSDYIEGRYG